MENSEKKERFDYLFIGTGNSALVAAALLTNAGKRVLMLEAHDIPGGYAQSFAWGDYFCGQVHYIWGCGPEGKIYKFLQKIGLEKILLLNYTIPTNTMLWRCLMARRWESHTDGTDWRNK